MSAVFRRRGEHYQQTAIEIEHPGIACGSRTRREKPDAEPHPPTISSTFRLRTIGRLPRSSRTASIRLRARPPKAPLPEADAGGWVRNLKSKDVGYKVFGFVEGYHHENVLALADHLTSFNSTILSQYQQP